ncbi:hypothetical protein FRC03_003078 [Tulasnella sp. 419]|nr:hypothetical protein FRC03_003078 [Tulasnella sp. 419]
MTCGSAPINGDTLNFFKYSFMCDVVEDDLGSVGSIGGVQLVNEVKLVDVPELSYSAEDKPNPRGELCIRGDNVFSKYFKDEENTRAAIDAEGWFHTGDIAEIDSNGRLKIIDRLKNIMKLAQGEYVALEKIENLYTACPVVAQVYIHGDSLQDHLLAVIVPEPVALSIIAAEAGYKFDPKAEPAVEAACKDETVRKAVLDDTIKRMKKVGLKGFEIAKDLHLTTQQFTVENNTMTPTFKIKRKEAYAFHKEVLDGLYAKAKAAAK